jgi:6-phosphofructokinase 1
MEKTPAEVAEILKSAYAKGKAHAIIVVAEGCTNNADELIKYFKEREAELGFEIRAIQLGHVQRGGTPGAFDRLLATRLGAAAVKSLDRGEYGVIVGLNKGQITTTPYTEVTGKHKSLDLGLMDLAKELDG